MRTRLKYGFFRGIGLLLSLLCLAAAPGKTFGGEDNGYSESEKVGFAFYQMAGTEPDYKRWVTNSDKYKTSDPEDKNLLLQKETYRLMNGFNNYLPDDELVELSFPAKVVASQYYGQSQKLGSQTDVTVNLVDLPENYFPFLVGDMWVAVVVKDYDLFTHYTFTSEEYKEFAKVLGFDRGYRLSQNVAVDLKLRPLSTDTSMPMILDGLEMWLMLAEIGEMNVWIPKGGGKSDLWSYQAPWYVTPTHKELLRLYKN